MSFLSRLFGGGGASGGLDVESAVTTLSVLYDDPEVVSERGIAISGPRAEIDTHSLAPGVFILTISDHGSCRKFKVIKSQE